MRVNPNVYIQVIVGHHSFFVIIAKEDAYLRSAFFKLADTSVWLDP